MKNNNDNYIKYLELIDRKKELFLNSIVTKKYHSRQKDSDTAKHHGSSRWFLKARNNELYLNKHSVEFRLTVAVLVCSTASSWNW